MLSQRRICHAVLKITLSFVISLIDEQSRLSTVKMNIAHSNRLSLRCPVKYNATVRGNLLATGFAAVKTASFDHTELSSATARANKTMRKAKMEEKLAVVLIGTVFLRKTNEARLRLWKYRHNVQPRF